MKTLYKEKLKIQCPSHNILDLIYNNKWSQVKRSIFFHKSIAAKCTGPCKSKCNANHSILHYACQFHPPLDIVKKLYKAHPNAIYERDCKERYVLHIACKHGCSPDIITYLLQKNPEASCLADIKGRTPLLLAYKSYVFKCGLNWCLANKMLAEVSSVLAKQSAFVINQEDKKGMTALEYAIEEEYNKDTLEVLHIAIADYHRNLEEEHVQFMNNLNDTITDLNVLWSTEVQSKIEQNKNCRAKAA